jgi:hypothetical protein
MGEQKGEPVFTDEAGSFTIKNLQPVSYRVRVRDSDGLSSAVKDNVRPDANVTLRLAARVALVGHVRSDNRPVTDYVVCTDLIVSQGTPGATRSIRFARPDGSYQVKVLEPGSYRVAISAEPGFAARKVEIANGTVTADFDLEPWVSASGRLVTPEGLPVVGAELSLGVEWFNFFWTARTDSQGTFHFPQIASGKAKVMMLVADDGGYLEAPSSFDIGPGHTELGDIEVAPSKP